MSRENINFNISVVLSFEINLIVELSIKITCTNEIFFGEVGNDLGDSTFDMIDLSLVEIYLCTNVRRKEYEWAYNTVASIIVPK